MQTQTLRESDLPTKLDVSSCTELLEPLLELLEQPALLFRELRLDAIFCSVTRHV